MIVGPVGLTLFVAVLIFMPYALSWVVLASAVEIAKRKTTALASTTTIFGLAKPAIHSWLATSAAFFISIWFDPGQEYVYPLFPFVAFGACLYCTYRHLCKEFSSRILSKPELHRWCIGFSFLPALTVMVILSASMS